MKTLKQEYMDILCQCFSPGCNYLAAGNNYGEVAVFDFALQPSDKPENQPRIVYKTGMSNVFSLVSAQKYLIAGGDGPLTIIPWDQLYPKKKNRRNDHEEDEEDGGEDDDDKKRKKKKKKKDEDDEDMEVDEEESKRRRKRRRRAEEEEELRYATVDVLSRATSTKEMYINALALSPVSSHVVYCARSDGVVVGVDIGRGSVKSHFTLNGPSSTSSPDDKTEIFCLAARCHEASNVLVGGTSDGRVAVWDVRAGVKPRFCLEPAEVEEKLTISERFETGSAPGKDYLTHGHYVSAVDIRGDWVVCGGSMNASMWHLGTRKYSTIYECENGPKPIHAITIASESKIKPSKRERTGPGLGRVIIGGKGPNVAIFTPEGQVKAVVSTGNTWTYSLKSGRLRDSFPFALTVAGTSNNVSVFSNLMYPSFDFQF